MYFVRDSVVFCCILSQEWTSKFISIEDPFDLNHNLAAGVSHKMTKFIIGVFVKAREHFASKPNGMKPFDDYRLELVHVLLLISCKLIK